METLQVGYLHAVAAAAGCSLAQPFPDNGIDWHISHSSHGHGVDDEVTIKVQLKCTYQVAPRPPGPTFGFTLENEHLVKLARTPVSVHKILVVMLVPRTQEEWLRAGHDRLELRHCCYWTNLAGHAATGKRKTTVRIPTARIFDDRALCEIMTRVGAGGGPDEPDGRRRTRPARPRAGRPRRPRRAARPPRLAAAWRCPGPLHALDAPGRAGVRRPDQPPGARAAYRGRPLRRPRRAAGRGPRRPRPLRRAVGARGADRARRPRRRDPLAPRAAAGRRRGRAVDGGEQLRAAARAMLMSAARAERDRFGYFGARHTGHANAFLEQVLVGAAPGHQLTAYAPVPEGRRTVTTLLRAAGGPGRRGLPADHRRHGGLRRGGGPRRLPRTGRLPDPDGARHRGRGGHPRLGPGGRAARGVRQGAGAGRVLPGDLPALEAASERYVREEPSVDVRVTGTVTRLRRPRPSGGGSIRLRVLAGADVRHVRIRLSEEGYRIAAQAHLVGLPVRLSGRLERRTGFCHLTHPSALTPVHVDEADRDRLMKALHGGVDTFEDSFGG